MNPGKQGDTSHQESLRSLITIGKIMVMVPTGTSMLTLALAGSEQGEAILNSSAAGIATVFFCGLTVLVYAGIRKFLEAYRGHDTENPKT
jgi:hypothetical protein